MERRHRGIVEIYPSLLAMFAARDRQNTAI
jgi:hypothetical protein